MRRGGDGPHRPTSPSRVLTRALAARGQHRGGPRARTSPGGIRPPCTCPVQGTPVGVPHQPDMGRVCRAHVPPIASPYLSHVIRPGLTASRSRPAPGHRSGRSARPTPGLSSRTTAAGPRRGLAWSRVRLVWLVWHPSRLPPPERELDGRCPDPAGHPTIFRGGSVDRRRGLP